ncbi:hypothetical protein H2203_001985 [Taxawa tesnikishii (nom. ined.)]|nr:hypothetical protein H2203_001985 [Dothideales sp. JES 119]
MAEAGDDPQVTFNIKSSNDTKYVVTMPTSMTVADLKNKLSTSEYADLPAARQRLIYSGRVLKDPDTLATYKIKDGNTVHLVRGAESNQRQNPANQGDGSTPDPEQMLQLLENPNFAQQMNEAMNNPEVLNMMRNSPMMRNNPMMQQVLDNPELRRMMFDPNMIRAQMRLQRAMGGFGGAGGGSSFPAPGVTDTTQQPEGTTGTQQQGQQQQNIFGQQQNPLAGLFGGGNHGMGGGSGANPFAALFGGNPGAAQGTTPAQTPPVTSAGQTPAQGTPSTGTQNQQNPFANLFGAMGGQDQNQGQSQGQGSNPLADMTRQMMQNPEMMRAAMDMMGGMGGQQGSEGANSFGGFNPFAFGGMGEQQQPADNRPPEERYESQLRQLNEMGFHDFERNVQALRRSGGSVQGAVEYLFSGN